MKLDVYLDGEWKDVGDVHSLYFGNDDSDDDTFGDEFEIGNVVAMRGQVQLMTVEDYCDECDSVDVVWFSGNDVNGWTLHRDTFDGAMLVNLSDDDGVA